jgi:hypothetical protein
VRLIQFAAISLGQSPDDLSNRVERVIIGVVGLALPLLLYLIAGWRPQSPATRWQLLPSISAYYYSGSTAVFVGLLATLAVFLFAYQGYANPWHTLDVIAARVAATASVFVAFFPTGVPEGYAMPPWWKPWMEHVHAIAAAVLFSSFAFFALFLFRRTDPADPTGQARSPDKRWRDKVYLVCGVAIVIAIVWTALLGLLNKLAVGGRSDRPIFSPECMALIFFAISWLVKGHVDQMVGPSRKHAVPVPASASAPKLSQTLGTS